MNLLFKLLFYFKNPPLVIVLAQRNSQIIKLLSVLIKRRIESVEISSGREPFPIFGKKLISVNISDESNVSLDVPFFLKRSSSPILIINGIRPEEGILKIFPERGLAVADTETARTLKDEEITVEGVGFDERSDLWASDLNIGNETNFKINHGGDSVPFWIGKKIEREEILEILLAVRAGMALGLNLVQMSQNLKE